MEREKGELSIVKVRHSEFTIHSYKEEDKSWTSIICMLTDSLLKSIK